MPLSDRREPKHPFIWYDRRFLTLFAALFISGSGGGMAKIALLWLSFKLTGSAAAVGFIFVCLTGPGILIGLFSGGLADRFPKRNILIIARISLAVVMLGFPLAYHQRSMSLLYVLAAILGGGMSFVEGPFRAYLPEIFEEHWLARINSLIEANRSLTMMIGPAVGGIILASGMVQLAFYVTAAAFLLSALLLALLPYTRSKMSDGQINLRVIVRDLKEGVRFLAKSQEHRFMLAAFISLCGIYCISGGLLMPYAEILAKKAGTSPGTALAAIEATLGLGGLLGSFFIPTLISRLGYLKAMVLASLLCVIELLTYGFCPNIYVILPVTVVTASSFPLLMVTLFTRLQKSTESRFMGRVMGAFDTMLLSVVSVAFGVGGIIADRIGTVTVFIVSGFLLAGLTVLIPLLPAYRTLLRAEQAQRE